ncbi:uncharacterized protein LOC121733946 [Aricia agestis]|uniref:uncharacterized protein LOC121733946 n=1 Tax=Aricia agestis TaxID=91739 RepID=UPI001C209CFD|nr:uncharacterized protein LOC121733946 [Aricia agestis]
MDTTLLLAAVLYCIVPVTHCMYVTPIHDSPGLYFDKLIDIKFTSTKWNVVTHLNVDHVKPNLNEVEFIFERVNSLCNSIQFNQIRIDCRNSLAALRNQHLNNVNKFSSISYLVDDEQPHRRSKRGLFDFGGSILKTFFGTLDSEDAIKYSDAINQVQTDEKQLVALMKDNIHIIRSTINSFNSSINKVNENENILMKNMDIIQKSMQDILNSNDQLVIKTQLNSVINALDSIILSLSFSIDDINNAILFSKLNILHPTVLSPHQLFSELDKHRNDLPKHFDLPVTLSLQNIHELVDISDLICYFHANKIIIIIKIPLVLPQTYNLYNVISFPVPYDIQHPNTFILIAPSSPYVAITQDHMFYSLLSRLDECKVISEKCYICELKNVYSVIANPTCETVLLSEVVDKIPSTCQTRLIHGSVDLFHKLSNNRWIYVQSEPGKCHVSCNDDLTTHEVILFGTGVFTLPRHCKGFYKTLQFTPSDLVYTNDNITANM